MADYTLKIVAENLSLMTWYGMTLNGNAIYASNVTQPVEDGDILQIAPDYGSVYLNGTLVGKTYTHTIHSDVTVTCSTDYNAYIVAEESGGHKAMINGVVYEITGGTTMVDGTAADVSGGSVMVDGTVYEISV